MGVMREAHKSRFKPNIRNASMYRQRHLNNSLLTRRAPHTDTRTPRQKKWWLSPLLIPPARRQGELEVRVYLGPVLNDDHDGDHQDEKAPDLPDDENDDQPDDQQMSCTEM